MNSNGTAIRRSSLLCRSMLKFISSLLHYLTFEASSEFFSHFCVCFKLFMFADITEFRYIYVKILIV